MTFSEFAKQHNVMFDRSALSIPELTGAALEMTNGIPARTAFMTIPAGCLPEETRNTFVRSSPFRTAMPTTLSMALCLPMSSALYIRLPSSVHQARAVSASCPVLGLVIKVFHAVQQDVDPEGLTYREINIFVPLVPVHAYAA